MGWVREGECNRCGDCCIGSPYPDRPAIDGMAATARVWSRITPRPALVRQLMSLTDREEGKICLLIELSARPAKVLPLLEEALDDPDTAVRSRVLDLVIAYKYKKVDARKAFAKTLSKNKMLFLSEKMYDSEVPKFIDRQISSLGLRTKPNIPALLSEYLGTDLSRISNELSKLKMILKDTDILDEKIIETHIGISKDFNTFELTKTLAQRDAAKAMRVAYYLGKSAKQNPFEMIMGSLYGFYSNLIIYHTLAGKNPKVIQEEMKLNYYQVEDLRVAAANYSLKHATRIISVLREFDMKRKGLGAVNMNETQLLTEMTYKILNVAQLKVKV
jgi:DNA polymerase-3 subunit delta